MPRHRAGRGAGVAAGGTRVAEAYRRHPPGPPLPERDGRGEQAHHRHAVRRREVRRAGVADHHGGGPGDDAGQFGEVGAAPEVHRHVAGHPGGDLPLVGSPGDQHPVTGTGERPGDARGDLRRAGTGRRGRTGVQHHVPGGLHRWRHRPQAQGGFVVVGQRVAGGGGEGQGAFGFGYAHRDAVPDVQQTARVVVADRRDPGDAGGTQQQGQRQRGLVEAGEDDRLVRPDGGQPAGQRGDVGRVDRPGVGVDPRQPVLDDLVDAREEFGGGPAPRPAEQHYPPRVRGDRPDPRPGDQHVPGRVGAHHQHRAGPPVRRRATGRRPPVPSDRPGGPRVGRRGPRVGGRVHRRLTTQDLPHRAGQVRRHPRGRVDLLPAGHRRRHQDRLRPRRERRRHVPADVTHQHAARRRRPQGAGGGVYQPRGRLAAPAAGTVVVRTHQPRVERAQQVLHPRVHRRQLRLGEQSPGQAGLVRHHRQPQPRRAQPVQGLARARQGAHLLRIAVVRHVVDQRPVPVEQHRVEQSGTPQPAGTGVNPGRPALMRLHVVLSHGGRVPCAPRSKRRRQRGAGGVDTPDPRVALPVAPEKLTHPGR
ncbi:hypothetical protein JD76_02826 [Micromonospora endolithica]|nr:hypothetical protein JD76_02826 [Micromonospora endolithica]